MRKRIVLLMLAAALFTTGLSFETGALCAVNAFVAALAAFGSYELTFGKKE